MICWPPWKSRPPADPVPRLPLSAVDRDAGRALVERTGLTGSGPLIGLFPGAEFGPSKRWPWRRFAELAQLLRRRLPAARILIVVGPKETWLGVRVHEESGRIHPLAGPDLDLARLARLLSALDVLVTNDSGPMHLAAAVGVPVRRPVRAHRPRAHRPGRRRPPDPLHRSLVLALLPPALPAAAPPLPEGDRRRAGGGGGIDVAAIGG